MQISPQQLPATASKPPSALPHVLVVDDEEDLCELLALRLKHEGFDASTCSTGKQALQILESRSIDAVVLDLRLDGESGLDLLAEFQKIYPDLPVVMLTAHGTLESAVESMKSGAYGFVTKPFDDHDLIQELRHAVEHGRLKEEVAGLRRMVGESLRFNRMLGTSKEIVRTRELIKRAAPSDATVLITGESGTGKEVTARCLHEQSPRAEAAFIAINCGALPADLLESELFGYVRGAFTGATKDKEGLLAAAEGGTIFLDEVGDAPASVQVKLLRVLQERVYLPVGATQPVPMNVRIIAATNRDLTEDVKSGRFREDLFYRLHVVPINMPALRQRVEDIPILTDLFLTRTSAQYQLPRPNLTERALQRLLEHAWPGNVRELANVVEGATIVSHGQSIELEHIEAVIAPLEKASTLKLVDPAQLSDHLLPLKEAKAQFEENYLKRLLEQQSGNVSAAAKIAGRHRTDLHELLKRHGINAADYRNDKSRDDD